MDIKIGKKLEEFFLNILDLFLIDLQNIHRKAFDNARIFFQSWLMMEPSSASDKIFSDKTHVFLNFVKKMVVSFIIGKIIILLLLKHLSKFCL